MPTDTLDSTFAALADTTRRAILARLASRGEASVKVPTRSLRIRSSSSRVFDAPRQLVFEAWTEPEHFVRWCSPKEREFANRGAQESVSDESE